MKPMCLLTLLSLTSAILWLAPTSIKLFGLLMILWSFAGILFTACLFETLSEAKENTKLYENLLPSRILNAMSTQKQRSKGKKALSLFDAPTMTVFILGLILIIFTLYQTLTFNLEGASALKNTIESHIDAQYTSFSTMYDPLGHTYIMGIGGYVLIGLSIWIGGCVAILSDKSKTTLIALTILVILSLAIAFYNTAPILPLWLNIAALLSFCWHNFKPSEKKYRILQ